MGQQEETRSIAAHDSLTKIYNFTAFCESSRKYLLSTGAGRSMGVIYANIIDFKSVNELYGLPEGDRMLGAFADFLKHLPRTRVCGRIFRIISCACLSGRPAWTCTMKRWASQER